MDSLSDLLGPYAEKCEQYLMRWVIEPGTPETLADAMRYCVLDGGKRLRPALVMMSAEAVSGGEQEDELTARAAVAVELVHCYSLVHDDLPCMDDDALRRGRATAHVKFGETMAVLVGDALLTRAFGVLTQADRGRSSLLVSELASGAGAGGMVGGQVADVGLCEVPSGPEGLRYISLHKTAAMIRAAARMGAVCGAADAPVLRAVSDYAESLGLAFQLVDDLLDVTGEAGTIGKTPGKDRASGRRTHAGELGVEAARRMADELTARATEALEPLGENGRKLRSLAELLAERAH